MRILAAIFLLAVACFTASGVIGLRAPPVAVPTPPTAAAAHAALASFEASQGPDIEIDVGALYAGRLELLDPRLALPTWHKHARAEAVAVHRAERECPPPPAPELDDASLAKAYAWHALTCGAGAAARRDELLEKPPFMHPSGRSYVAMSAAARGPDTAWLREHARGVHVLEIGALDGAAFTEEERALGELPARAWEELMRGDAIVATGPSLVVATRGPLGLGKLRLYRRAAFDAFAAKLGLGLAERDGAATCGVAASADLCWEAPLPAPRHKKTPLRVAGASAAVMLASLIAIAVGYVRGRRRMHLDRVHVLRTLTHELRTPATSLRLDVEPLRAAYDDLPAGCQEPLLRISDGVERLHRVLQTSVRFMALFEPNGATRAELVHVRSVDSARALFEELADEWPEGVTTSAASDDGPLGTDPEWLGVAVKNLVENAARHGEAPVCVTWALTAAKLCVRVGDAGQTRGFSLRRAVTPFGKAARSTGLGLGLAMVARVAELLGGRLSHEPSPTVFQLAIPNHAVALASSSSMREGARREAP